MSFEVQLVSPERVLYTGQANQVLCRTVGGGDIAFLTGHAPMIGALDIWSLKVTTVDGDELWFAVHGGFVEVSADSVIVLSDVAEAAGQIDEGRAGTAKERADSEVRADPDDEEVKAALQRAEVRLEVASK
ncbi:MAG TPA: ATP synthase F1 subunit epsilon [Acidimicrobiales bacterium]